MLEVQWLPSSLENITRFKAVENDFDSIMAKEDLMRHHCLRVNWLKHGNRNSQVFHQKVPFMKLPSQGNWIVQLAAILGSFLCTFNPYSNPLGTKTLNHFTKYIEVIILISFIHSLLMKLYLVSSRCTEPRLWVRT